MSNFYAQFKRLFPDPVLLAGTVTAYSDGYATVQLPDGGLAKVRGTADIGDHVFIRDGLIEGPAPVLTSIVIEV